MATALKLQWLAPTRVRSSGGHISIAHVFLKSAADDDFYLSICH
jgi:hypothetical protein